MHPFLTTRLVDAHRNDLLREAGEARRAPVSSRVRLRPLDSTDREHIVALFNRLSPRSRYLRYLAPIRTLPERSVRHLVSIDHRQHEAVGAFTSGELVGVAHYFRSTANPDEADISIEVADTHQRHGVGGELLAHLTRLARDRGITRFTALVAAENTGVLALLERWRPTVEQRDGATLSLALSLG